MNYNRTITDYEIIVVGAGHSGVEAAFAAARLGAKTLLLTLNLDSISFMACNPNIGGTAKGHLVREIDALGGQMGINADKSLLQLKMLNVGKGPAVHSLRGQADKNLYHENMKHTLEKQENLDIVQDEACEIVLDGGKISGIICSQGTLYTAKSVVLATGVYLNARIIIGEFSKNTGPNGFEAATKLTASLMNHGVNIMRFKTGTPARVNKNTIDFDKMTIQEGDDDIYSFSVMTDEKIVNKMPCYLTYTNENTHKIILDNISRSPLYNGFIHGVGPRYCPSIEDKVKRFADKNRHQVFVEPEGENTDECYIQGMSSSLPIDVQDAMYHSIAGLEHCHIMRYAYAIEYDCIDPMQLTPYLMIKSIPGVFTSGQINGSSGYEEAAAQGLIAGINAYRFARELSPFTLGRDEAYIGVLIDDLVTKGTKEPYRMMTARAEYRLHLRQDNADLRLTQKGYDLGLVSSDRYERFLNKKKEMSVIRELLSKNVSYKLYGAMFDEAGEEYSKVGLSFEQILKRSKIDFKLINRYFDEFKTFTDAALKGVEVEVKYEGYLAKQNIAIDETKRHENTSLDGVDYDKVSGLRKEAIQKLKAVMPLNLGQASRISGVNNADITVLMIYLLKKRKKEEM